MKRSCLFLFVAVTLLATLGITVQIFPQNTQTESSSLTFLVPSIPLLQA